MSETHHSPTLTQSDGIDRSLSYYMVLEEQPPHYIEKISRYLASSVGQSGRGVASEGPCDLNSDSGESLFITQNPVPEAVRSGRRRRSTLRSDIRFLEGETGNEYNTSASSSAGETGKEIRSKAHKLPRFSFPFLTEGKKKQTSAVLPAQQNRILHTSLMAGYFKCVRELWESYQRGGDMLACLPTVDTDGDHISPISEEEEDPPKDEEFKVVERKRFVVLSKAKSSQSWYITQKTNNKIKQQKRRPSNAGTDSQGGQWKAIHKAPTSAASTRLTLSPDTDCSDHEDSSCTLLQDKEKSDKDVMSSGNIVAQSETSKAERTLKQGKKKNVFNRTENETKLVNDSDAIVCESRQEKCKQKSREASTAVTELQTNVFQRECEPESHHPLQSDYNNDMQCSETGVKKKKKKKKGKDLETVEEKKDQSQEELEGESLGVATTEVGKAQSMSQVIDEPDATDSKKKKKKKKSAVKDVRQDADEQSEGRGQEDSVVSCSTENGHKKKKKRKTNVDVECFQTNAAAEHLADDGEIPKKRIKELKKTSHLPQIPTEHLEETGDCFENAEAHEKTLESSHVKRKKDKKKKKRKTNVDDHVDDHVDVECFQTNAAAEHLADDGEIPKKKKKRIKELKKTSDLPQIPTEHLETPGDCFENAEACEKTLESIHVKRKKDKKKKKRKTNVDDHVDDHVDVECFQTNAAAEHLADDGEIPKKRIKELKKTSDLPQIPTEHLETTGDCFENAEAHEKTLESSHVKRKKDKKKKKQSNYDTQVGEDARKDVDFSNDSITLVRSTALSVKKKTQKNVHISFTPEEDENVDNAQTTEALEEQDAEITIKKKKKKEKSAKSSTDVSEDPVAPSECSVSAWKKETKRTSSFLAADEEENAGQMHRKKCTPSQSTAAHGWCAEKPSVSDFATEPAEITGNLEASKDGVKKKKRSAAQETLEGEPECEEPEETSEPVVKKKKKKRKRDGSESVSPTERLESAADEIVVLTKGKKKDAQGTPPAVTEDAEPQESTLNTCGSFSTKRKGKRSRSAEIPHDRSLSNDQTSRETPVSDVRDNKKKMAGMEALKTKKKERKKQTADCSFKSAPSKTSDLLLKTSSSNSIRKNNKAKRRLYSPSDAFLADC